MAQWTGAAVREADTDAALVGKRGCGAGRRTGRLTGLLRRMQGEEDGTQQGCWLLGGKRARGCCPG